MNNFQTRHEVYDPWIEKIGSFDPLPNVHNEKLIGINFERLRYWIAQDVEVSKPVAELLGKFFHQYIKKSYSMYNRIPSVDIQMYS